MGEYRRLHGAEAPDYDVTVGEAAQKYRFSQPDFVVYTLKL